MFELDVSANIDTVLEELGENYPEYIEQFKEFKQNASEDILKDPFKFWLSFMHKYLNSDIDLPDQLHIDIKDLIVDIAIQQINDFDNHIIFVLGLWREQVGEEDYKSMIELYRRALDAQELQSLREELLKNIQSSMAWNDITRLLGNYVKPKDLAKQPTFKLIEEMSRYITKHMPMITPTEEEQKKFYAKDNSLQLLRGWFEFGIFAIVILAVVTFLIVAFGIE